MSDTFDHHPARRRPRSWPSVIGSEAERASKAMSRLEDITRLIAEWVWEADADGRLTFVSPRIFELAGTVPQMLVGKRFAELGWFSHSGTEDDEETTTAVEPDWGRPFRDAIFKMRNDKGQTRVYLVSGIPFFDKETWALEGICGTARDVTDSLDHATQLHREKEKAETANRIKTEFLANVSHELRTPLNAILGFSDVMLNKVFGDWDSERYQEYVESIHGAGQHLLSLINDIIDVSAVEAGRLDLHVESVNLPEVFSSIQNLTKERASQGGIDLALSGAGDVGDVVADERRLKQILLNLVVNAVKFTGSGGRVCLHAERKDSGAVLFRVTDSGIGMQDDEIDVALRPFSQLHSGAASQFKEGSGLGLPLTKGLVEAHGGAMTIASAPGKGTTVEVTLPALQG